MTSSSALVPLSPQAGGLLCSLSCRPGGGWGPWERGWGLTAPLFPQSPAFCNHPGPPVPTPCLHRSRADDRHYLTRSELPAAGPWPQPAAERGQKILRLLGAACGIRGVFLHVSDSSCCSQPEDRGCVQPWDRSDTLHSDPVGWRSKFHLTDEKTEAEKPKDLFRAPGLWVEESGCTSAFAG